MTYCLVPLPATLHNLHQRILVCPRTSKSWDCSERSWGFPSDRPGTLHTRRVHVRDVPVCLKIWCHNPWASDIIKVESSGEDPRATGGLVSNIPHPRANKTKQHHPLALYTYCVGFPKNYRSWVAPSPFSSPWLPWVLVLKALARDCLEC